MFLNHKNSLWTDLFLPRFLQQISGSGVYISTRRLASSCLGWWWLHILLWGRHFSLVLVAGSAAVSAQNTEDFPIVSSKKGLQVQMVEDALALGIKHAALNVNFAQLLQLQTNAASLSANFGGTNFYFARGYVEHLDRQIKPLSDRGVIVSLILLYYRSGNDDLNKIMLHPGYHPDAPNHLSAFNTSNPVSSAHYSACVEFLARRYNAPGAPHGRVWNYIVGNEVNSHWYWSNMGRVTMEEFADDYLRAVRFCHQAVRRHSARARVYLSLEHHWNIAYPPAEKGQAFAGRPFLDYFARQARAGGDFDWHLAFHPYPENLGDCRTWNDQSALPTPDTPRITFKNLEVLPKYLERPELLYCGQPRRIILSEQGFHSPESEEGQILQAAAYAYAWQKVSALPSIDSFILHRHVDHGQEGGLNLGLWTRKKDASHPAEPAEKKRIYEVFRLADTPQRESAFEFALPIIGLESWSELEARP